MGWHVQFSSLTCSCCRIVSQLTLIEDTKIPIPSYIDDSSISMSMSTVRETVK